MRASTSLSSGARALGCSRPTASAISISPPASPSPRSATPIPSWSRRLRSRREALARLESVPHPARRAAGRPAVRGDLRRHRVLHQFRRRGDRMRDQDGAQISIGQRPARALPHHQLRGRLPRPHAGGARGRPATRNISRASARRSPGFDQVPFGDLEAVKAAIGPQTAAILIEPIQGEGGVRVGRRQFPARPARALRRARPAADLRRDPDAASAAPASCSPMSAPASRPTSWRSPRRSAAASRSAPASPPRKPPRA